MAMARTLPAAEIGLFRIFFLYLMAVPALSLSVGLVNGIFYWGGRGGEGLRAIRAASVLICGSALLFCVLLIFAQPVLMARLGFDSSTATYFAIACIPAILTAFYESACIARGKVWMGASFNAFFELLRAIAMLSAVIVFHSMHAVITAHLVVSLLKILLGVIFSYQQGFLGLRNSSLDYYGVLRYAAPVSVAAIFDTLVNYSDRYIVSALLAPENFAIYMMGCLAVPPLQIFEQSVNKVLIPSLAENFVSSKGSEITMLYRKAIDELLLIYIPAVTGLLIFADPIINLLFTARFAAAADYLRLYAFSYLLLGIPYDAYFRAMGNSRWILKNAMIFGCLSLLLGGLFTWEWGAFGALASSLVVQLLMRLRALVLFQRETGSSWRLILPLWSIAHYLGVSLLLAAFSLIGRGFFTSEVSWFFICGTIFGLAYLYFIAKKFRWLGRIFNS